MSLRGRAVRRLRLLLLQTNEGEDYNNNNNNNNSNNNNNNDNNILIPTLYKGIKELAPSSEEFEEDRFEQPGSKLTKSHAERSRYGNKTDGWENQTGPRETRFVNKSFPGDIDHKPTEIKTQKRVNIDLEDDIAPLPRRKRVHKEHSV